MKLKNIYQIFFFIAITTLVSCSSSEDNGDGNGNGNTATSININPNTLFADFGEPFTFTVKTNDGTDVTSSSTILVNNSSISGNSYTPPATGEYTVKATYNDLTSSTKTITVLPVVVSIDIESNSSSVNIGDTIEYTVIATDNNGNTNPITGATTVFINGSESVTGNKFIPGEVSTVSAYATFEEFTTSTIEVSVVDQEVAPASFTRKALIEDYTGTWCGWCPRVSYGIELVKGQTDNVVVVANHLANGDPYENTYSVQMANAFGISGFPTAYVNRASEWTYPEPNNVSQVTSLAQGTMPSGISINSAIKDNNLSFVVSAGFAQNTTGAKLVVFLLENGLLHNQENYTDYYNGVDVLVNFQHDHVLRYAFTPVLGQAIPAGEVVANNIYNVKYDFAIPSGIVSNTNNLEIVAMLVGDNDQIINVNMVSAGGEVDFN